MSANSEQAAASAPAAAVVKDGRPAHWRTQVEGGFEGREALLGQAINMVIKTLNQQLPYQHHVNDGIIKAHLTALQFVKNLGLWDEYVAHDVAARRGINERIGKLIAETGNKELALESCFDITECHYQLVLETQAEPGQRTFRSPFIDTLETCRRIGQMDMTAEEVHERWYRPRLLGYAKDMGVEFRVSDLDADGNLTVEVH
jgi:hypothetical protein